MMGSVRMTGSEGVNRKTAADDEDVIPTDYNNNVLGHVWR